MRSLEILDCCGTAQVEQVLTRSDVAGLAALASCNVSQGVLDSDALAENGAAGRGFLQPPELLLERLVFCDRYAATLACSSLAQ